MNEECYLLIFYNGVSRRTQKYKTLNRAIEGATFKYGHGEQTKIYKIRGNEIVAEYSSWGRELASYE